MTSQLTYPLSENNCETLKESVIEVLKGIYDPDIPIDIYKLGLIYGINIESEGQVSIQMTLTYMGCPHAQTLVETVETKVAQIEGVTEVAVELVFDPPWSLSDEVRLELNLI